MVERLAAYGGRAATVSGVLAAVAAAVLVLFFALEAPAIIASGSSDTWTPLGRTNDTLVGLSALTAIPLAFRLHRSWRLRRPGPSSAALAIAVVSMLTAVTVQLVYAANLITTASQGSILGPALAGFGVWQLAVNLGGADPVLAGRLKAVGVASGIGYVLTFVSLLAVGGSSAVSNPQEVLKNPVFVVLLALGTLGFSVAYPIWAIWVGRRLPAENA